MIKLNFMIQSRMERQRLCEQKEKDKSPGEAEAELEQWHYLEDLSL